MSMITRVSASYDASQARTRELEAELCRDPGRFRVLTGDRPTGSLHVGHLFGTLANRVRLQDLGVDVMVLVADYQTITDRESPASLPADVLGLIADYLAVGIDPGRATIFAHSQVEALNQLMLPFLSLVSVAEVSRNPTVKDPVHQAADILFCHANLVPVGSDQLPHIELTRMIARRFNDRYSPGRPYFPEPDGLLSDAPLILGMDGGKMSKSRGNAIALAASEDETAQLIRTARTDTERQITYEPERRPEISNLVLLAALCLERSPAGGAGLKRLLTDALNERLRPLRQRRRELADDPSYLSGVLAAGTDRAREIAAATLSDVRELMHNDY